VVLITGSSMLTILLKKLKYFIFGAPRNINDLRIFHKILSIPFLNWVWLGVHGLFSSSYGREEAFNFKMKQSIVSYLCFWQILFAVSCPSFTGEINKQIDKLILENSSDLHNDPYFVKYNHNKVTENIKLLSSQNNFLVQCAVSKFQTQIIVTLSYNDPRLESTCLLGRTIPRIPPVKLS
jgi:hypothetical protein